MPGESRHLQYGALYVFFCDSVHVISSRPRWQTQPFETPITRSSDWFPVVGAVGSDDEYHALMEMNLGESHVPHRRHTHHRHHAQDQNEEDWNATSNAVVEDAGIKGNTRMDWPQLEQALLVSVVGSVILLLVFSLLRICFPSVYSFYAEQDDHTSDSFLGWIRATWEVTRRPWVVQERIGFDCATLLDFYDLCINICIIAAAPNLFVAAPVFWFYGSENGGVLSKLDLDNIAEGSRLHLVTIGSVWFVIVFVRWLIDRSYENFLNHRFDWMTAMPNIQACTLFVEGIPIQYRTDDALCGYFNDFFPGSEISTAHLVRNTGSLPKLVCQRRALDEQMLVLSNNDDQNLIVECQEEREALLTLIAETIEQIENAALTNNGDVCSDCGFVTFASARAAAIARHIRLSDNVNTFKCSTPPAPNDIIYGDLQSARRRNWHEPFGYGLILVIFVTFMPLVGAVTALTDPHMLREKFPFVESLFQARPSLEKLSQSVVASLLLNQLVSSVPYLLFLIHSFCFSCKSVSRHQHEILVFYYTFQLVFILLVTTLGGSLLKAAATVEQSPDKIFRMLTDNLPAFSHFYLNYVLLAMLDPGFAITRITNLVKSLFFNAFCGHAELARSYSELEDQTSHGIGVRVAKASFLSTVVLVLCSTSPLITLVGLPVFLFSRLAYGYLMVFAEPRKLHIDTGGMFWRTGIEQILGGLLIYATLMTGLILKRVPTLGILLLPAGPYVFYASKKMHDHKAWRDLSFERIVRHIDEVEKREFCSAYYDPDLLLDSDRGTSNPFAVVAGIKRLRRRSKAKARGRKSKPSLLQSSLAE